MASPDSPGPTTEVKPRIFVIKKKKAAHGGHHGGAWKVAYADFVTAMMSLFIVLWLMSADDDVKKAIAYYFNNPSGTGDKIGSSSAGLGNALQLPKEDMDNLRDKIQQALSTMPNFAAIKDHVEMSITPDGLRIELLETEAGMFFESGRPVPTDGGSDLLTRLAEELGKLPNHVLIEGHTDSRPYSGAGGYSNWELSTDRANSARKLMEGHGIRAEQVAAVRGYADRQPRHPDKPEDPSNRRISVIVQYLEPPPGSKPAEGSAEHKAEEKTAGHGEAPKAAAPAPAPAAGHAPAPATAPAKEAPKPSPTKELPKPTPAKEAPKASGKR